MKFFDALLRHRSINRIHYIAITLVGILMFLFTALIITREYLEFQQQLEDFEQEYLKSQKDLIRKETIRALRYIEYKHRHEEGRDLPLLQKEIVDAIEQMRDERDGTGYVFIYTFEGINIADPILKQNAGKNMIGFTDPDGTRVIADLITVSQQPDGGYVEYVWNKPVINLPAPKISYAKAYQPWGWMVGSGVYLDTVQKIVAEKKQQHRKKMVAIVFQILLLAGIMLGASMVVLHFITRRIGLEMAQFKAFFDRAVTHREKIDRSQLFFSEFHDISLNANRMIDVLNRVTHELESLNHELESRVERKTEKLRKQAEALQNLIDAQDRFVKNAIHEIYTPISIIFANIELLELRHRSHHLTNITAAAKTIHNIYDDLSYIIKQDRIEYTKEAIPLGTFLQERIVYFSELAEGNALVIRYESNADPMVYISAVELQRLIDNTLSNAIKYSPAGEAIDVRITDREKEVVFSVSNRSLEEIHHPEKLFERYYRENEARGGFGLGLGIVKDICDKNGIKVDVTSPDSNVMFAYTIAKYDNANFATGR